MKNRDLNSCRNQHSKDKKIFKRIQNLHQTIAKEQKQKDVTCSVDICFNQGVRSAQVFGPRLFELPLPRLKPIRVYQDAVTLVNRDADAVDCLSASSASASLMIKMYFYCSFRLFIFGSGAPRMPRIGPLAPSPTRSLAEHCLLRWSTTLR